MKLVNYIGRKILDVKRKILIYENYEKKEDNKKASECLKLNKGLKD